MPDRHPDAHEVANMRALFRDPFFASYLSGSSADATQECYYVARQFGMTAREAHAISGKVSQRVAKRSPPVTMLELFLTSHCNLACSYCFVEGKSMQAPMSLETAKKSVEFLIRESREKRSLNLLLMGGEPMLRFSLIESLLPWAKAQVARAGKSLRVDMTTNGTLLNQRRGEFLNRMGVMVLLSLDGDRVTHDRHRIDRRGRGSFDRALRGLEVLRRHQGYVGVKMTVAADEVGALVENVRALSRRGVHHFILGHATGTDWSWASLQSLSDAYLELHAWLHSLPESNRPRISVIENTLGHGASSPPPRRHRFGCRAGRHSVMVAPTGELFPCSKAYGVRCMREFFRLGSLTEGFTNTQLRGQLTGQIATERETCWNCAHQSNCFGGCVAVNASMTGDPLRPPAGECRAIASQRQLASLLRRQEQRFCAEQG
jgi:uncharacterized protein